MGEFVQGLIIGFSMAAPVGPINLLCLRRSLTEGRRVGFISGLGAAAADTTYGAIAAVGLTAVTSFLVEHRPLMQLATGIFLLVLGFLTTRSHPTARRERKPLRAGRIWDAFATTYVYTLANPLLIIVFTGVFASLGLGWRTGHPWEGLGLIGGVFIGATLWWLTLTMLAGTLGRHLNDGTLKWINRFAGGLILAIGVYELVAAARSLL
jgi:threonine/homoserine/homoserine lactone efflux protein